MVCIWAIDVVNWNALDLNLLRVLDAMLSERNTTRVGERIGLSQPAVSSALNRLRMILGNALFIREGRRMVPTPFAASIQEPLRQALDRIERAISGVSFDPAKSTRVFRMIGDDYLSELLLPKLVAFLMRVAPGICFQLLPSNPRTLAEQLGDGTADLAFWITQETPDWVERAFALASGVAVVASRTNRRLARARAKDGGTIPLDLYCELPQVQFAPDGNLTRREDRALAGIGRRRHIVLTVPDFFGLSRVVAQSELIGGLPPAFARSISERLALRVYTMPCKVDVEQLYLYWHRRHTDDPEHKWIREHILELLRPLDVKV
jgi:DNA-binding transcriptional LysR family regulator